MNATRTAEIQYITVADNHYCAFPKASAYKPGEANWSVTSGFTQSEAEATHAPIIDLYSAGEDYPKKYFDLCDQYPRRMDDSQFAEFIAIVKSYGYTVKGL